MKALIFILGSLLIAAPCFAENRMKSPFPSRTLRVEKSDYQSSTVPFVLTSLIQFYSKVISPIDGPRSPSYPTGSAYGIQAIKKYGAFPGVFLISDRLIHEADLPLGPTIIVYGHRRYYDPLEANTYWWDRSVLSPEP